MLALQTGADLIEQFKDASCVGMLDLDQLGKLNSRPIRPIPAELWRKFGYAPNQWALVHLHTSGARFTAVCTCRQSGKTEGISMEIADRMTEPPKRGDQKAVWNTCDSPDDEGACTHFDPLDPESKPAHDDSLIWAAPNYVGVVSFDLAHVAKSVARYLFHVHSSLGEKAYRVNKNEKSLTLLATGAQLRWFTSNNPDSVQGETFTFLFYDEAQNVSDETWENALPALDVRMAGVLAVGTPDPRPTCTWFKGLFLKGEEPDEPDYYSYTLPCWENRWETIETIAQARDNMSEAQFRKKYLGQWVDDDTAVFKNIDANFTGRWYTGPQDPQAIADGVTGPFVIGLDVARAADYTVAYVVESKSNRVVARFRMNHINFTVSADAVEKLYKTWGARGIHMDVTAMGHGLREMLRDRGGMTIWGAEFTNEFKGKLVAVVAKSLEKQQTILAKEDRNLRRELKAFTRVVTPAGNVRYTAPSNYNDDTVIALGLALLKANRLGKVKQSSYMD